MPNHGTSEYLHPEAVPLLRLLSCFSDSPVPFELLLNSKILRTLPGFEAINHTRLWTLLGRLNSFSLISLTGEAVTMGPLAHQLVLHPLVRETSRLHPDVRENIDPFCAAVSALLILASEGLDPHRTETWARWQVLAPHCTSVLDLRQQTGTKINATLEDVIPVVRAASYWTEIGLPDQVEPFLLAALDVQRRLLGEFSLETLKTRSLRAAILHERGLFEQAAAEYRSLVDDEGMHLELNHLQTLATRDRLARVLRELGQLDEAQEELRVTLAARVSILGPNHADTLISRRGLALMLENRGNFSASEAEYKAVIKAQTQVIGQDHPDTLGTRHNLARVLQKSGQLDLAEGELQAILRIRRAVLGESHRNTIEARYTLAFVRQEKGNLVEAEAEYRAVLDYRTQALGLNHPTTLLDFRSFEICESA